MIVTVHAKPGSRKTGVEPRDDGSLLARIHSKPEGGKANDELVELLADHFDVAKSRVRILTPTSRYKRVEIIE